jgi:octaprenyl-diphosphate synthase
MIELIHYASLVHDDVIDRHSFRRGHPSLNNTFADNHAVLIGDYLMCEVIGYGLGFKHNAQVIRLLIDAIKNLVAGLIIEQNELPNNPSLESYSRMVYRKTGSLFALSFGLPFVGDGKLATAMSCGQEFGFLFQIYDDFFDRSVDQSYLNIFHILSNEKISKLCEENLTKLLHTCQGIGIEQVVLEVVNYLQSHGYFLDMQGS